MEQTGNARVVIGTRDAKLAIHGQEMTLIANRECAKPGHHLIGEQGADIVGKRWGCERVRAKHVVELAYPTVDCHNARDIISSHRIRRE